MGRRRQGAPPGQPAAGGAAIARRRNAKNRRKKKKQRHVPLPSSDAHSPASPTGDAASAAALAAQILAQESAVSSEDVAITIRTLKALAADSSLFHSPLVRGIRSAVYELPMLRAKPKSIVGQISDYLRDHMWDRASTALRELEQGPPPPLGALQRWVRDCDRDAPPALLALALRCAAPELVSDPLPRGCWLDHGAPVRPGMRLMKPWVVQQCPAPTAPEPAGEPALAWPVVPAFHALLTVAAADRRPANLHPQTLWRSLGRPAHASDAPSAWVGSGVEAWPRLSPPPVSVCRHSVPGVPGAFLVSNVLAPQDCDALVALSEAQGYAPDCPLTGLSSVLADALCWIIPQALHDQLWRRLQPHLPRDALGFNRRWRMYRYRPGNVYRPHIDGAWPGSGIRVRPNDGAPEYEFDAFGDRYSKLTMLFYFNDLTDDHGGATTFFLPCAGQEGVLNAFPVRPQRGSVLFFPHGEVRGSLLHEGSALRKGTKYVCRTEVLFPKVVGQEQGEQEEEG